MTVTQLVSIFDGHPEALAIAQRLRDGITGIMDAAPPTVLNQVYESVEQLVAYVKEHPLLLTKFATSVPTMLLSLKKKDAE